MKLILVRHGETVWNRAGREMGHLDSPLTELGILQATAIGERVARIRVHALYTSDLGRTRHTAEIIGARCGKEPQSHAGLRERHMGAFQGLTRVEMREKFPAALAEYDRTGFFSEVPGGEDALHRVTRAATVLGETADRHPNEVVVVVTHGGLMKGFLGFVLGLAPGGRRYATSHAGYSEFSRQAGRWRLETWNDTSHLQRIGETVGPATQETNLRSIGSL